MVKQLDKVKLKHPDEDVRRNLEKYCEKAVEFGATRARVMPAGEVIIDERVVLKCQIPRCFGYGVCAHCPPHTIKPAELREQLKNYSWAVFFTKDIPPEVVVRDKETIKERVAAYQNVFSIVNKIESLAFYDGYYLSVGFAAGSCRHTYCSLQEDCQALQGKKCRFALRARPSMEAVGMDVYKMATNSGWDIFPIGSDAQPCQMDKGVLAGIVIVT